MGSQRDALHVKGNAGQSDRGQWITGTVVRERGNASRRTQEGAVLGTKKGARA